MGALAAAFICCLWHWSFTLYRGDTVGFFWLCVGMVKISLSFGFPRETSAVNHFWQ